MSGYIAPGECQAAGGGDPNKVFAAMQKPSIEEKLTLAEKDNRYLQGVIDGLKWAVKIMAEHMGG